MRHIDCQFLFKFAAKTFISIVIMLKAHWSESGSVTEPDILLVGYIMRHTLHEPTVRKTQISSWSLLKRALPEIALSRIRYPHKLRKAAAYQVSVHEDVLPYRQPLLFAAATRVTFRVYNSNQATPIVSTVRGAMGKGKMIASHRLSISIQVRSQDLHQHCHNAQGPLVGIRFRYRARYPPRRLHHAAYAARADG